MPTTPTPPPKDDGRFDDWAAQLHRNTTKRVNWTPTLTCATPGDLTVVYSARSGELFYSGGMYVAFFTVATSTFTHTTSAGSVSITGLPVTCNSDSGYVSVDFLQWQGITKANYTQWGCFITAGVTPINFLGQGSGQSSVVLAITDMPSAGAVILRGTLRFR